MSPDGLPMVGKLPGFDNVFVNCGHGTMGWTLCCATGSMIAQMVTPPPHGERRIPTLAEAALDPKRFELW
jgi:glycine/D-amino acid oxidase-like deaminating enzyme